MRPIKPISLNPDLKRGPGPGFDLIMLERKASKTIDKYSMLSRGDRVLVCVSGGPDSVCLLEILDSPSEKYGIELTVCHVDHMMRKEQSRADAEFTREIARDRKLPFFSCRKNVRLHAKRKGCSVEEAGRDIRYEFFKKTAAKQNISKIPLGHNLDDQAETVLLNLMRGSGLAGMSGIPPSRSLGKTGIEVIRPLIESSRAEIEGFLSRKKISFREDLSNKEPVYMRNRLRMELLPCIESNFEAGIKHKLAKTAGIIREYMDYFTLNTADAVKEAVTAGSGASGIKIKHFRELHPAVRRLLLQEAFNAAAGRETPLSSNHIEQLNMIARSRLPNRRLSLPFGISAWREYGRLIFKKGSPGAPAPAAPRELAVPGINPVPELGIKIEFILGGRRGLPRAKAAASMDFDRVRLPVSIRRRMDGDRFSPLGMTGTKKLKDFLMDEKIPLAERDRMPVLVDADNRILCVFNPESRRGAIDDRTRITGRTKRVLQVRIV